MEIPKITIISPLDQLSMAEKFQFIFQNEVNWNNIRSIPRSDIQYASDTGPIFQNGRTSKHWKLYLIKYNSHFAPPPLLHSYICLYIIEANQ